MSPRNFALFSGVIFLIAGLLSLIPSLSVVDATLKPLSYEASYGLFLGLFPMNLINKIALIAFGLAGLWSYASRFHSLPSSIIYARWVFAVMGAASILGMAQSTNTLFGYWPLYGNEIWFHGVFSLLGAYFGYRYTSMIHIDDQNSGLGTPATSR